MVFHAQGGSREVPGRKGAVQGSQMDPLDGPIAGLVEGDTFFQEGFRQREPRVFTFTFTYRFGKQERSRRRRGGNRGSGGGFGGDDMMD